MFLSVNQPQRQHVVLYVQHVAANNANVILVVVTMSG